MEMDDIFKRYYKEIGDLRIPKFKRAEAAVTEMENRAIKVIRDLCCVGE